MTDKPPTEQQLAEIETRAAHLYEYADPTDAAWEILAGDDVPQLLAEVRRLRTGLAAAERIRENADFHLGQEMARRQLAEKETARLRDELERRTEDVAFLERTTLPELRREIEHHKDGKQRWRGRAEKAEARVAELAAVHAFLDEQELAARLFELPTPAWVEAVRATSVPPGAPLSASPASSVSESAQSPTGAAAGRLGDLPSTVDLASADDPTHLRWGLNDVQRGDDGSVIVMFSGPDREAYWLELDPERAAALREDLAGPDGAPSPERDALIAELLPAWEAMYEPGNVSDYLIGYANSEAGAKGAAEAWMRSQAEVTGRLEWERWGADASLPDGYDVLFELIECHDDGIDTGPGIAVRRRIQPTATEGGVR